MKETVAVVFSKDRPLQLKALLDSFSLHCTDSKTLDLKVITKSTDDCYNAGYESLSFEYPEIEFIVQGAFSEDLLRAIDPYYFVLFLVDDTMFINDFKNEEIKQVLVHIPELIGFSLRLGFNTKYCYMLDKLQELPRFEVISYNIFKYKWVDAEHDFGYPLEVSSSVYRVKEVQELLKSKCFDNPNELEDVLVKGASSIKNKMSYLACYTKSVAFSNPINKVQTYSESNRSANVPEYTSANLCDYFRKDYEIDVHMYSGLVPKAVHQEIELYLKFRKSEHDIFVTVVIPCYNQSHFLNESIGSILNQTYKKWEIIIVDDGSPDNTQIIGNDLIRKYPQQRIRYFRTDNNGLAKARNYGIARAAAEWILPLDADDLFDQDFIAKAIDIISKDKSVNLVYCNMQEFGVKNGEWVPPDYDPTTVLYFNTFPYAAVFKKSLWEQSGGYYEGIPWGAEDWNFWITVSKTVLNPKRLDEKLFLYRTTGQSMYDKMLPFFDEVCAFIKTIHSDIYPVDQVVEAIGKIHLLSTESQLKLDIIVQKHPNLTMPRIWRLLSAQPFSELQLSKILDLLQSPGGHDDQQVKSFKKVFFQYLDAMMRKSELSKQTQQNHFSIPTYKNVGILCDYYWPSIGGVEHFVEDLATRLKALGINVTIICRKLHNRTELIHNGFQIYEIDADKCSTHNFPALVVEELIAYLRINSIDRMIAISQPDNWVGNIIANLPPDAAKIIYLPSISAYNLIQWAMSSDYHRVIRSLNRADSIVAVSENGYDSIFLTSNKFQFSIIPHCIGLIDTNHQFRQEHGIDESVFLLVTVANFWPVKNHKELIHVIENHNNNWLLYIIGNVIEEEKEYYAYVRKLVDNNPRIKIIPGLSREATASAIKEADLLLVPSIAESAGPLVVLQAMSYGTPWIATPRCNSVQDEAGGIVVNLEYFPEAIEYLQNNRDIYEQLSTLGKEHWERSLNWNSSIHFYIKLLEDSNQIIEARMPSDIRERMNIIQSEYDLIRIKSKAELDFSVIIPTYRRTDILKKCLKAIANQEYDLDKIEVIVCDDGTPNDDNRALCDQHYPYRISYLWQENSGPAAARNMGIKIAKGKYLLILNDDAILHPEALKLHYKYQSMVTGDKIAVLGLFILPRVYTNNVFGLLANSTDIIFNYPFMHSGILYNYHCFYTCNLSILRKSVLDIGMFNEIFKGPAAEDIELGYRLWKSGYHILYIEDCIAEHDHPVTLKSLCKVHDTRGYGAATLYFLHPELSTIDHFSDSSLQIMKSDDILNQDNVAKLYDKLVKFESMEVKYLTTAEVDSIYDAVKILIKHHVNKGMLKNDIIHNIAKKNSPNTEDILLTVVIPCYNYGKYLEDSVKSVIVQNCSFLEIIIVDDGSTDNSLQIAKSLQRKYSNTPFFVISQPNSGQPAIARNNGISEARGKYILPLDADDILPDGIISRYLRCLKEHEHDEVVIYGSMQTFGEHDGLWRTESMVPHKLLRRNQVVSSALFSKSIWENSYKYATNVRGYEDWDFWIGAYENKAKFIHLDTVSLLYRETKDPSLNDYGEANHEKNYANIILNHPALYESFEIIWAIKHLYPSISLRTDDMNRAEALRIIHYPHFYTLQQIDWASSYLVKTELTFVKGQTSFHRNSKTCLVFEMNGNELTKDSEEQLSAIYSQVVRYSNKSNTLYISSQLMIVQGQFPFSSVILEAFSNFMHPYIAFYSVEKGVPFSLGRLTVNDSKCCFSVSINYNLTVLFRKFLEYLVSAHCVSDINEFIKFIRHFETVTQGRILTNDSGGVQKYECR